MGRVVITHSTYLEGLIPLLGEGLKPLLNKKLQDCRDGIALFVGHFSALP